MGLIGQQVERHKLAYQQHACAPEPAVTEDGLCCLDVRLLRNQLPSVSSELWSIVAVTKLVENEI